MNPANTETFEAFMARALHDPVHGYYARNIRDIGARGDFTTAPQLSEAPGKAVAAWVAAALRETGAGNVIEIGPGLGTLARQVIRNMPLGLRLRTRFHLVESSPRLREKQRELLGKKVHHHSTIHAALEECRGKAVIYSNELVDAFPVRLFGKKDGSWREIALDHSAGYAAEIFLPPAELPPSCCFRPELPEGQRVEVHDSYRLWLGSWLPALKNGAMLTIDYGDAPDNPRPPRLKGTLRAYFLHQRTEGPEIYLNPGLCDITADVNFTDLAEWSRAWLESEPPMLLSQFMLRHADVADSGLLQAAGHFIALSQKTRAGG